jgi:hypothetical protein
VTRDIPMTANTAVQKAAHAEKRQYFIAEGFVSLTFIKSSRSITCLEISPIFEHS